MQPTKTIYQIYSYIEYIRKNCCRQLQTAGQLWRVQCDEGHGRKTHDQVLLQATVWEAAKCLSLFRICVKSYVYAVFLRLPCESIPTRQHFHLADKLITARVFNAHVGPARTKYARLHKSGDTHILFWWQNLRHACCTLSLMYAYKMSTCTLFTQYLQNFRWFDWRLT